jgi:hypothetical protein
MENVLQSYTCAQLCDFVFYIHRTNPLRPEISYVSGEETTPSQDFFGARVVLNKVAASLSRDKRIRLALPGFFLKYFYRITRYVHNTIRTLFIVRRMDVREPTRDLQTLLDDPRIQQIVSHNVFFEHPKLQWLPIGISGELPFWTKEKEVDCCAALQSERLLYVNFSIATNSKHRGMVAATLSSNGFHMSPTVPVEEFMSTLRSFKFCASPDGTFKDCFRTWEAIYSGCTPLVDDWPYARRVAPWLPVVWVGAPPPVQKGEYLWLPSWEAATRETLLALDSEARDRMQAVGPGFLRKDVWIHLLDMDPLPSEPLICAARRIAAEWDTATPQDGRSEAPPEPETGPHKRCKDSADDPDAQTKRVKTDPIVIQHPAPS